MKDGFYWCRVKEFGCGPGPWIVCRVLEGEVCLCGASEPLREGFERNIMEFDPVPIERGETTIRNRVVKTLGVSGGTPVSGILASRFGVWRNGGVLAGPTPRSSAPTRR
jgi:hypothetical protein